MAPPLIIPRHALPCTPSLAHADVARVWLPGGAWASLPRDTLHVVLTKAKQAGLELSEEASAELEGAEAAAARFSHAASGEPLVNADPQATATAVVAQLAACMPELQVAGECPDKRILR